MGTASGIWEPGNLLAMHIFCEILLLMTASHLTTENKLRNFECLLGLPSSVLFRLNRCLSPCAVTMAQTNKKQELVIILDITHWSCHAKSEPGLSLAISPANLCSEFNFLMSVRQLKGGLDGVSENKPFVDSKKDCVMSYCHRGVSLLRRSEDTILCQQESHRKRRATIGAISHKCHRP